MQGKAREGQDRAVTEGRKNSAQYGEHQNKMKKKKKKEHPAQRRESR
jgi:hypothetical protein